MKKFVMGALLVSVLLFVMSGLALAADKETKFNKKFFRDEDDASWAATNMAAANLKGLLKGDPDGRFRPNDTLKRVEMITAAVRFANQEEAAQNLKDAALDYADSADIAKNYAWGKGYLKQAAKAGMIPGAGRFEPGRDADRLWAAEVLVKALGLQEEAESKESAVLDFADAADVPKDKVGYLAVALEKGILQGYPDGTFKPFNAVSRAELSTLLTRADEKKDTLGTFEVKGTVVSVASAVYGDNLSITIGDAVYGSGSTTKTYKVSPDALVLLDGQKVALTDLKPGYKARLLLNAQGTAILVTAKQPKEEPVRMSKHRGWLVELPSLGGQQVYGLITGNRWGVMEKEKDSNDKDDRNSGDKDDRKEKGEKRGKSSKVEAERAQALRAMILLPSDDKVSESLKANLGSLVEVQGQAQKGPSIYRQPVYKVYNVIPVDDKQM